MADSVAGCRAPSARGLLKPPEAGLRLPALAPRVDQEVKDNGGERPLCRGML